MQVRQLPADRYHAILALLDNIDWPRNRRAVINGKGICLGATYHLDGLKVAGATRQARMEDLCREINVSLSELFPPSIGIVWGSLQINADSVAQVHRDKNNVGLSLICLFGNCLQNGITRSWPCSTTSIGRVTVVP